ncbi:hypothetical protein FACS1894110_23260 [Spirochaetia bacterium]|nr:hypothetical protein FACS1894110_23260 [Spirochaetia bacterium]
MKMLKEQLYTNIQSSVNDFASIKYQMQWQRISQMQQNASILLAIITFSITILFQIINIEKNSKPILDNIDWNFIVLPGICSSLFIGIIASIFLFKVIMPKTIKTDLPLPKDMYKELVSNIEAKVVTEIAEDPANFDCNAVHPIRFIGNCLSERYTMAILEINSIVENNQRNYTKGLVISFFSIGLNILLYSIIIFNIVPNDPLKIIWYGLCIVCAVTALVLAIIFERLKKQS